MAKEELPGFNTLFPHEHFFTKDTKNAGVFVYSDPGGAKPVLSLANQISNKDDTHLIISDRKYSFQDSFNLQISTPGNSPEEDLVKKKARFLFTGTSYTSNIELSYIEAAKKLNIPSLSFVDAPTNILRRFNFQGTKIFPDYILVPDEETREKAISEGISREITEIFPNPWYAYLKSWSPKKTKEDTLKDFGITQDERSLIVFVPDPISNIPELVGKHGFSETEALRDLLPTLRNLNKTCKLIVVPHPNQNISLLERELSDEDKLFITIINQGSDINALLYYSDLVLGFFSNALIEAQLLGTKVLRYIKNSDNDPLRGKAIGLAIVPTSFNPACIQKIINQA